MASVGLEHVEKVYPNGTRALIDCTFEIGDGELLVLVGPSGCGKSTVLRLIAGLEDATGGTIRIGDTVVNGMAPQERNVAMVFQDYALYPHMTVRQNLEFPLRMRRMARDEIERKVQWMAGLLGIGQVLDRLPKQLSGGQRQRVAMGRALVREPAVSLLDEPLSNLDAKLRVQVRAEIDDLQERTKTTMVYVTHDQVEAMTLGNRVAVMNLGRVIQIATPRELYDHPRTAFVAGFIGNPPMNLFPARVAEPDGAPALVVGASRIRLAAASAKHVTHDGEVTAGIRPEALDLAAPGAEQTIAAVVEHVEWLGHETLAYVRAGAGESEDGPRLVARLAGMHPLTKGQPIVLAADTERIHLFDRDGAALN
jgi:multiple sugar transport system ATP-binding protein